MQAEGLTRSIGNFGRFLDVAGLTNGEQVNFAKVASDTGLAPSTVREHYRILEDTLVGDQLPAFRGTRTRKRVATAKFYFFDVGVANMLRRTGVIEPGSGCLRSCAGASRVPGGAKLARLSWPR